MTASQLKTIGHKVRSLRNKLHMCPLVLAERCLVDGFDLSEELVCDIENSDATISRSGARVLAKHLGVHCLAILDPPPEQRVGMRIAELRLRKKWSQKDLAAKMNRTQGQISNWELGKKMPTVEVARALGEAFGVKPVTFIPI